MRLLLCLILAPVIVFGFIAIVYTIGSIHWGLGVLVFLALPAWSIYDDIKKKGKDEEFEAWDDF